MENPSENGQEGPNMSSTRTAAASSRRNGDEDHHGDNNNKRPAGGAGLEPRKSMTNTASTNNNTPPPQQRPGMGGRLSVRSLNFNIPTNQGTHDHAKEEHGTLSWQYRALKFIHSENVQRLLMALLFLDVIILFVELLILANYPHCSIIVRDAISCCPPPATEEAAAVRFLESSSEGEAEEHNFCEASSSSSSSENLQAFPQYEAGCDEHKWSTVHTVEDVLFALTITILSIFFVELNVAMVALSPQIFFRQFFFMLDYIIITVSLVLELTFHFLKEDIYQSLAGLLVLVRIWRFIRIGHGIVEITNEMAHDEYNGLLAYTEALEKILIEHDIALPEHGWVKHSSSHPGGVGGDDSNHHNILTDIEMARREKLRQKYSRHRGSEEEEDEGKTDQVGSNHKKGSGVIAEEGSNKGEDGDGDENPTESD